jgi:aminocarboxymuconate-semialdehyde decarboxylase
MSDDVRGRRRGARPHPHARTGGIDLHTHLAPKFGETTPHGVADAGGSLVVDGKHIGPDALYRPQSLVDHLDQAALDTAIVAPPPPFYRQHLPRQQAARWVRAVNDGMLAAVSAQPRLRALAYLPLEHPDIAIIEYERVRSAAEWPG